MFEENIVYLFMKKLTILFTVTVMKMHSPRREEHAEQVLALRQRKEIATLLVSS